MDTHFYTRSAMLCYALSFTVLDTDNRHALLATGLNQVYTNIKSSKQLSMSASSRTVLTLLFYLANIFVRFLVLP
jgi:hypothetical protein